MKARLTYLTQFSNLQGNTSNQGLGLDLFLCVRTTSARPCESEAPVKVNQGLSAHVELGWGLSETATIMVRY